jgi:cyclopropane fatty-acyl-phospholipid synthase-like methyltransferase
MIKNIIIIVILLIFIISSYYLVIQNFFRTKNNTISYNTLLKECIHNVSNNNYFMNYGLWEDNTNTLIDANKNLINLVFDKSELENKKNMNILDIGCGYGVQDIEWSKKIDKSCKLTAIDISQEQIYSAMKKNSSVVFDICDSNYIDLKYKNVLFDKIISLESAFHYSERQKFFKNINNLLKEDGNFIITDIMLKNNYDKNTITHFFIQFFSDFLHIPKKNLITSDEWINNVSSELDIVEQIDITNKTFVPYYKHFMNTYIKNKKYPFFLGKWLEDFFCSVQPFAYKVVVCKKKSSIV